MNMQVNHYLDALVEKLKVEPEMSKSILLELKTHLEERVKELEEELEEEGALTSEAVAQAVRELGHPDLVAKGMYSVHSKGSWKDILLATLPHLLLAALFALHLWTRYLLVFVLLVGVTFVALAGWRKGRPKWTYSWLGYSMAAPALSWLMALAALAYGVWTFLTTGDLPLSLPIYLLILAYIPFSLWIIVNVTMKVVGRDWLLASLTALPFPFLTSWMLFLNWQGGLWTTNTAKLQESDGDRALVFLALAITTAVFLIVGQRLLQIALLTLSTAVLVVYTSVAVPLSSSLLAMVLITMASVAFLLSPAVMDSRWSRRAAYYPDFQRSGEVVTHWFSSVR